MSNDEIAPKAFSIRRFRATMAARIDAGEVVAVTRHNRVVGHFVPVDKSVPIVPYEIEPEDDDYSGPEIVGRVTESDGPRWHEVCRSKRLSMDEILPEG